MQIDEIQTKVAGVWKDANLSHVKVGDVWKAVSAVYVKVNGTWITKSSAPQIGDFVYSDKSFSSSYNSAKTCVGIIFMIDLNNSVRPYRIVSLTDSAKNQSGNNQDVLGIGVSQYVAMWGKAENLIGMPSYGAESQAQSDKDGAINMLILASNSKILNYTPTWNTLGQYPAHNFCVFTKGEEIGGSVFGWWLPAFGEMSAIVDNIDLINTRIAQAGGTTIKGIYFTSTQIDISKAWAYAIIPGGNGPTEWIKEEAAGVRAISRFSL